jgi:hypothetical protein
MKITFFTFIFLFGFHFKIFAQYNIELLLKDIRYDLVEGISVDSIHQTKFRKNMGNNKIDTTQIKLYFDNHNQIEKKEVETGQTIWNYCYFKKNGQIDSTISTRTSKDKHLIHQTTKRFIYDKNENLVKIIKTLKISAEGIENYSKSTNTILIKRDSLGLPVEYLDTNYLGVKAHEKAEYDLENEIVHIEKYNYNGKIIGRKKSIDFDVKSQKIKAKDNHYFNKDGLLIFKENRDGSIQYYKHFYDEFRNWTHKVKYAISLDSRNEEEKIIWMNSIGRQIFYSR